MVMEIIEKTKYHQERGVHIALVGGNVGQVEEIQIVLAKNKNYRLTWQKDVSRGLEKIEQSNCDLLIVLISSYNKKLDYYLAMDDFMMPVICIIDQLDLKLVEVLSKKGALDCLAWEECSPTVLSRAIHYGVVHKRLLASAQYQANHDRLTGLPNYHLFCQILEQSVDIEQKIAVVFIDIDHFKNVNDLLGHAQGDELLFIVTERFSSVLDVESTLSRFAGDEFTVLLQGYHDGNYPEVVAQRLLTALERPIILQGSQMKITASIGVAKSDVPLEHIVDLVRFADIAMYEAKNLGRNMYQVFTSEMYAQNQKRLALQRDLGSAIQGDQFFLVYQPFYRLSDGVLLGVEALLRWQHPVLGLIMPSTFIPIAEEFNFIVSLGAKALEKACLQFRRWKLAGCFDKVDSFVISVNVSCKQLVQQGFVSQVRKVLSRFGVPHEALKLEITETILMENIIPASVVLRKLHQAGIQLAIDDFGTGFSSLTYLKNLPFRILKIDKSFIDEIGYKKRDSELIIESILQLAHSLNLSVIAEGVETKQQLDFLVASGCDMAQGYYFCKPILPDRLDKEMKKKMILMS